MCEPRQVLLRGRLGKSAFLPSCLCSCQQEEQRIEAAEAEHRQRMERIRRRKARGLQDPSLYDFTFAHDNGANPLMAKARAYVEHWDSANRIGLLLFGDVGTGKSFFAGCIANALLDKDVPVLMSNFPRLLLQMSSLYGAERCAFVDGLNDFDLLILDDLGVERGTEYVLEQMLQIIDSRWRSRKPMIITTNLTLNELKNPPDLAHARIYDRILERCAPILFDGHSFRTENAEQIKAAARSVWATENDGSKND